MKFNSPEALRWRAMRKEAGLRIDPKTAEVGCWHVETEDPYSVYADVPCGQVGKEWFARSSPEQGWVLFEDLPHETSAALGARPPTKPAFDDDIPL
jgi:hypothetical protein